MDMLIIYLIICILETEKWPADEIYRGESMESQRQFIKCISVTVLVDKCVLAHMIVRQWQIMAVLYPIGCFRIQCSKNRQNYWYQLMTTNTRGDLGFEVSKVNFWCLMGKKNQSIEGSQLNFGLSHITLTVKEYDADMIISVWNSQKTQYLYQIWWMVIVLDTEISGLGIT